MTIYELSGSWRTLYDMADDPDMDAEVWFDTLEGIEGEIEVKAENYGKVIKQLKADAEAVKAEKDRLARKQQSLENKATYLMRRLQEAMELVEKDKIKTELFSFNIQNNPPSVFIADESRVPEEFLKTKVEVDKTKIKDWLKEGNIADWAELTQGKSLRMR